MKKLIQKIKPQHLILITLAQAVIATLGSLFFSEVWMLPPCKLCWFQRIAMYPLVVILAVGYYLRDRNVYLYAMPLVVSGLVIAFYHNLLYYDTMFSYGIVPDSIIQCQEGISCTAETIKWLGFVTIPLLSLISFIVIFICLWQYRKHFSK